MGAITGGRFSRGPDERGAAAIEFAIVLIPLVAILLGVVTGGLAYTQSIGLTNAVREGSRFGASTAVGDDWVNDVLTRTTELQFDDPADTTAVCVELVNASPARMDCLGDATIEAQLRSDPPEVPTSDTGRCVVRVWAGRPYRIALGVAPGLDGVMVREAVARYEGETC
jgi:Flp pilus assembly pilin Flp